MNVLNSSDESIEFDSEVTVALSSGLAKPILGGHVRFFGYLTDETLPREAALLVDETTLPGSEVGESALSSCGEGCAMALFGNGQPSIPAPAASASIGYRSKMEISPASALGSSIAKVSIGNTALCADFNGDRKVDSADLGIILGAFGPANNSLDINGDGLVDGQELALVLGSYGRCPR